MGGYDYGYTLYMIIASDQTVIDAADYLSRTDPILAGVIRAVGPCTIRPHTNYYQELVQSIIGQQLSLKAAAAIEARFVALFESKYHSGAFPSPEQILAASADELRGCGFSRAKITYVRDLAERVLNGSIELDTFDALTNDEIIAELTPVKGIGEWTVHMFLIFCMGRLDVLPVGDLGIKNGIRNLYSFDTQPAADDVRLVAKENHWHPYETVASWYVWQSISLS